MLGLLDLARFPGLSEWASTWGSVDLARFLKASGLLDLVSLSESCSACFPESPRSLAKLSESCSACFSESPRSLVSLSESCSVCFPEPPRSAELAWSSGWTKLAGCGWRELAGLRVWRVGQFPHSHPPPLALYWPPWLLL